MPSPSRACLNPSIMTRSTDRAALPSARRDGHGDHGSRDRYQQHNCARSRAGCSWCSGGARSSVITVATRAQKTKQCLFYAHLDSNTRGPPVARHHLDTELKNRHAKPRLPNACSAQMPCAPRRAGGLARLVHHSMKVIFIQRCLWTIHQSRWQINVQGLWSREGRPFALWMTRSKSLELRSCRVYACCSKVNVNVQTRRARKLLWLVRHHSTAACSTSRYNTSRRVGYGP